MDDKKIKKLTQKLCRIVKKSTKIYENKTFREAFDRHKFEGDDVTDLDIKTQEFIQTECKKIFKEFNFVGEEEQIGNQSNIKIIVDPIDGTVNFKHNIIFYGTQICILEDEKMIISVLYIPKEKKIYYANKFGSFENHKKICVSNVHNLKDAIVSYGDFNNLCKDLQVDIVKLFAENVKRLRMIGSSCCDNCLLARGSTDLFVSFLNNPWDIKPGQYLIKMANGVIFFSEQYRLYVCGNKQLATKFISLLKNIEFKQI